MYYFFSWFQLFWLFHRNGETFCLRAFFEFGEIYTEMMADDGLIRAGGFGGEMDQAVHQEVSAVRTLKLQERIGQDLQEQSSTSMFKSILW